MGDLLAHVVKMAREKTMMTQEEMAKKLGISRKTYLYLEKDPRKMTVRQASDFCDLTGIEFNTFSFTK